MLNEDKSFRAGDVRCIFLLGDVITPTLEAPSAPAAAAYKQQFHGKGDNKRTLG
jgi:hypothetical protein